MKTPLIVTTDVDVSGNKLLNVNIETPTKTTDPTNKTYVDGKSVYDTEVAKTYSNPFVNVGGIDKSTVVANKTIKELFDAILFPLILPTYVDGSISAQAEPIPVILGLNSKFTCKANISLGDRKHTVGNISCIMKLPSGKQMITYVDQKAELYNITCQFERNAIDPESLTELTLSVVLSEAPMKYDSYGNESPNILFQSNTTVSHTIKYRGILPVLYKLYNLDDVLPSPTTLTWENIVSTMIPIDSVSDYKSNSTGFMIPTTKPFQVLMIIPGVCKSIYINDLDNITECCTITPVNMTMFNSRVGYKQPYSVVKFKTGDIAYTQPTKVTINW